MGKTNILLEGNNSFSNHGCEAIARGTYTVIRKALPTAQFVYCPRGAIAPDEPRIFDPESWESHAAGDRGFFERAIKKVYRKWKRYPYYRPYNFEGLLNEIDVSLTLGGDNWSFDYTDGESARVAAEIIMNRGVPAVHWCSSIGKFDRYPERAPKMFETLKRFDLLLVRESETVAYLAENGVRDNVRMVADPAFVMAPERPPVVDGDGILEILEKPFFGLNLGAKFGPYPADPAAYENTMLELVKGVAVALGYPVVLIPHVMGGTHYNDRIFLKGLAEKAALSGLPVYSLPGGDDDWTAPRLKWVIAKAEAFAGARTHATIASLSSLVPTFFLSYSLKSIGICKDILGSADWLSSFKVDRAEPLVEKIAAFWEQRAAIRSVLEKSIPLITERSWLAGEHVKTLLESHGSHRSRR